MNLEIKVLLATFVISVVCGLITIPILKKLRVGQIERDDGPASHLKKQGTPTMGGIIMIIAIIIAVTGTYIFLHLSGNQEIAQKLFPMLLITIGYGLIGFIDDFKKLVLKNTDGLKPRYKMLGLLIIAVAYVLFLIYGFKIGTETYIPILKTYINIPEIIYIPFAILVILGTTNAVNLTDGLDGLAASITTIVGIFFMLVSYIVFKEYGVTVFSAALIGGLIGFLWYNKYPAKVFMGDTGSLFLGASVALMAIDLKMPIHLILIGFVYFMETLSVIMQTAYFKYTKKKYGEGRRIFKMSPIHHHFEMCGWKEKKIVAVFTLVTVITCAVAYFAI